MAKLTVAWCLCARGLCRFHHPCPGADVVYEDLLHRPQVVDGGYGGVSLHQKWTDGRSKLLQELLGSMQIIKVFTYELPFLKRGCSGGSLTTGLGFVRTKELSGVRKILFIRAANQALAFSVPAIAAVLAFVTYSSTHPNMDPVRERRLR